MDGSNGPGEFHILKAHFMEGVICEGKDRERGMRGDSDRLGLDNWKNGDASTWSGMACGLLIPQY